MRAHTGNGSVAFYHRLKLVSARFLKYLVLIPSQMSGCCVYGCSNRYSSGKGLKFYRIPSGSHPFQSNRRRLWLQAINRVDWTEDIIKNARVCSAHFISGEASMDSESPDFVPSVFAYTKQSQRPEGKIERYSRKRKRDERKAVTQPAPPPPPVDDTCTVEETAEVMVPQKDYEDLVTKHGQLQEECVSLRKECEQLRDENAKLKEKLKNAHFTCSTVKPDLTQFVFLTGLTTVIFDWLLGKLVGSVKNVTHKLSLEDHLFIILIKLRMGFSNRYLAYKFNVTDSTISGICRV